MSTSRTIRVALVRLSGMDPTNDVATLLAEVIVGSDHPQIASVKLDPSGPDGWCRLKVGFADGSTAFIGTAR